MISTNEKNIYFKNLTSKGTVLDKILPIIMNTDFIGQGLNT